MKKIIKDIRYYGPINNTEPLTKKRYSMPKSYNCIGVRYTLKLRELEFYLNDYSHLYIDLKPAIKMNESIFSDKKDQYHPWYRNVDYGYSIEKMNNLSDEKKLREIQKITKDVLLKYCCENKEDIEKVNRVYKELIKTGELTDIFYRTLKSGKKEVKFILNVLDNGEVNVFARCNDLFKNNIFVKKLDDISIVNYALGRIKTNNGVLTIIPKKNRGSEYYKLEEIKIKIDN